MQGVITELVNKYGYGGIVILIFVENIFPPIPSEIILTFGGFLTTYTRLTVLGTTIFSTIGSVFGAIALFSIGKLLSPDRLNKFIEGKIGKRLRLNKEDIDKARETFLKRGNNAVFFCRFIPILRSMISIPAGMSGMKFGYFIVLTTLGSFVWNLVLISLGAFAGKSWEKVAVYVDMCSDVVKIVVILLIVILILKKILENLAQKKAGKGT